MSEPSRQESEELLKGSDDITAQIAYQRHILAALLRIEAQGIKPPRRTRKPKTTT